jgi:CBS domain-containing protein
MADPAQSQPLASPFTGVRIQDVMRPGVVTCDPGDSLAAIAATMVVRGIHAVIVAPLAPAPPVIVTDRDLVRAALESSTARAADVAYEPVATLRSDATLDDAVRLMAEHFVSHLIATDPESGAAAGVVSSYDVAAVLGGYEPRVARMLRPAPARPSSSATTLARAAVKDVMYPGVVTCIPGAPLSTVARTMADHHVHCVAVAGIDTSRGDHLTWGLIEDMDIVLALHRGAADEAAGSVATTAPVAIAEGDSLERAAQLMVEHDTAHVVVVSRSGLPFGMLSTLDIARVLGAGALP